MTLYRRFGRLDARAPDLRRARLASMTDAELDARITALAGRIGRDAARDMADPEAAATELRAEIEALD